LPHQERTNIAVFIDFDNIEIGVKTTLGEHFDIGTILEALKERGEVVTKIAYADWTRAGEYSRALTQHAIRLVQRNLTPGGDKNGADINLALDALEMAFTHPHINAYVIVGGDSDFLSLVEKLKQYDKKVLVVGGTALKKAAGGTAEASTGLEQARIFDRFYRGGGDLPRRVKGAGIGLSLVKRIVEDHGGSVFVASRPGEGSTFTINLKVAEGQRG